ncbi:MAG: hypothetical protein K8T89_18095 [Planctomycetes bacterium]|nr:hypothetical protein [Planctomycetota bacterium]
MNTPTSDIRLPPSPPRAVAISGMIFAALYIAGLVLARLSIPANPTDPGAWLADPASKRFVHLALNLIPFAGITFLWFMAVLRNRVGGLEDRFFATVFLGSGYLFVAMLFVAGAVSQGLLDTFASGDKAPDRSEAYTVARSIAYSLMNIFAVKMSAVFIIVTSSIGLRTAIVPRWIIFLGYAMALVMLLAITDFAWIALVFPIWVLLLSIYILLADMRQGRHSDPNGK